MIEITFKGDNALAEIQAFAAQVGVGAKLIHMARENAAKGEVVQPAPAKEQPAAPAPEDPKPAKAEKPKKAETKKPEASAAAPVVENVAQKAEDVFDDGPAHEDESQDVGDVPTDLTGLKDYFLKSPLTPNKQVEIVKRFSSNAKLSGIAVGDYPKVIAEVRAALAQAGK